MPTTDKKLVFRAVGGPYDGQDLFWPPPFEPMKMAKVLNDPSDSETWHVYVFNRGNWQADYGGIVVPRTQEQSLENN